MKIRKTVGIDLGTTNSVIALLDATDSALLIGRDVQGHRTFPSIVGYDTALGKFNFDASGDTTQKIISYYAYDATSKDWKFLSQRDFTLTPLK